MAKECVICGKKHKGQCSEEDWLKYIVRCCDNMWKNEKIRQQFGMIPPMLQLAKMRAETLTRLLDIYGVDLELSKGGKIC